MRTATPRYLMRNHILAATFLLTCSCSDTPDVVDSGLNPADVTDVAEDVAEDIGVDDAALADADGEADADADVTFDGAEFEVAEDVNADSDVDTGAVSDADAASDADAGAEFLPNPGVPPFGTGDIQGPYNVGYRQIEVTYSPRSVDETRTIPIVLWYPTLAIEGRVSYYADIFRRPQALEDAPLADTGRSLPLLVFSHGNSSFAEQSFFMTERFASHGWLVAAPDHVNNTAFDTDDYRADVFLLRMEDITATLDAVEADELLDGEVGEDVVLTGHSFGGYTTLGTTGAQFPVDGLVSLCEGGGAAPRGLCDLLTERAIATMREGYLDPRVDVAIPQAPAGAFIWAAPELGENGLDDIDVPTMLVTGARDATLLDAEEGGPIWDGLDGPADTRLHFLDAGHFTFSNMCDTLPGILDGDGCGEGFLEAALAHALINRYALAYSRAQLWEHSESIELLDSPAPSELVVTSKAE